jgi:tetratricopeptide (TPR) repeat protein
VENQKVEETTTDSAEILHRIRSCIDEGRYGEAEQAITTAFHDAEHESSSLYAALAEVRNRQRDFDAAQELAEQALGRDPQNIEGKFQLANACFGKYEIAQAEGIFHEIEPSKEKDPRFLAQLSRLYLLRKDAEKAFELAVRASQLDPDSAEYYGLKSEVLLAKSKIKEAIAAAKKAKQLDRMDADAWRVLTKATLVSGNRKELGKVLQAARKAVPDSPLIDIEVADYLALNQSYEDAETALQKVLRSHPDSAQAYRVLSRIYMNTGRLEQAVEMAYKALGFAPYSLAVWKQAGFALSRNGEHSLAMGWLHKALIADPEDVLVAVELAHALHKLHEFDAAYDLYRQILADQPDKPLTMHACATLLMDMERNKEAVELLRRAQELAGDNVVIQLTLATALADGNDFEGARAIYLELMEQAPEVCETYLYYTAITKMEQDEEITAKIKQQMAKVEDKGRQELLNYALAKIYEDKQDYETAFSHLSGACTLHKERCGYDRDADMQLFTVIKTIFSKEHIAPLQQCGDPSRKPIFVVGMPRSGTTLVEQILSSHPDIVGGGELHFMDTVLRNHAAMLESWKVVSLADLTCEQLPLLADAYLSLIAPIGSENQLVVDKMPHNFLYIGLIALMFPNAKIIHMQRNPMATCFSCFKQRFLEGHDYSFDLEDLGYHYLAYRDLMEHWRKVLPERVLEVEYEALTADFEPQARRIIDYCGVEWDDACLAFHKSGRAVRTASLAQVRKPIYKGAVSFWQNYQQQLQPLYAILHAAKAV